MNRITDIEKEKGTINLINTYTGAIEVLDKLNDEKEYAKMSVYKCMSRALGEILEYKKSNEISDEVNSKIQGALAKIKEKNVLTDLQMIRIYELIDKMEAI